MRPCLYKLDGKIPIPTTDAYEWARWYQNADCRVAYTEILCPTRDEPSEPIYVSTLFLGTGQPSMTADPFLFETMVFSDIERFDDEMNRYRTWDDAVAGHDEMVEWIRSECSLRLKGHVY